MHPQIYHWTPNPANVTPSQIKPQAVLTWVHQDLKLDGI